MVSKKQLEPKHKKTGIALLALIIIIVVLVSALILPSLLQQKIIALGDCAEVEYIGAFTTNGTIFTTTYDDAAHNIGGSPQNLYVNLNPNIVAPSKCGATSPSTFIPPNAIHALVGMKEGETKNITLSPTEAYGDWNTSLAEQYGLKIGLVNEIWNTTAETIPTEEFSYFFPNVTVEEGTIFDYWAVALRINGILYAKITNIANDNVTFEMLPENGTTFTLPSLNWTVTILVTNDTAFTIHSDIPPNHTFTFQDPSSGKIMYGKVITVNETQAIIGLNALAPSPDFVGQSLRYEFKVVKITKTAH